MNVSLRELRSEDLPLLLAWAHIKEIWTYLPTSRAGENLTWESHFDWWRSRRDRMDWMILANLDAYGPRSVGVVHISELGSPWPEIGLYMGEVTLWEKGIGKDSLSMAMDRACQMGLKRLRATIHPYNVRSVKLFKSLGFKKVDEARKGQHRYEYTFGGPEITIPVYQARNRRGYQPIPA